MNALGIAAQARVSLFQLRHRSFDKVSDRLQAAIDGGQFLELAPISSEPAHHGAFAFIEQLLTLQATLVQLLRMQEDIFLCLQLLFLSGPQTRVNDLLCLGFKRALFLLPFFEQRPRFAETLPHRIHCVKLRAHAADPIPKASESIQQAHVGLRLEQRMMLVLAINMDHRSADAPKPTIYTHTVPHILANPTPPTN